MKLGTRSPRTVVLLLMSSLILSSLPCFADLESGRQAANRGEFGRAYDEWRPLAEAGNAEAQYNLGRLYANGDGVFRSYIQAHDWFERAALQGHKKSQEALARMYQYGDGVRQDLRKSQLWQTGRAVLLRKAQVARNNIPKSPVRTSLSPESEAERKALFQELGIASTSP